MPAAPFGGATPRRRGDAIRIEEFDVLRDVVEVLLDSEVPRVETVYFGVRKVGEVGLSAGRSEEHVSLPPENESLRLPFAKERSATTLPKR